MRDLTDEDIAELAAADGYVYIGQEYTKHAGGLDAAARMGAMVKAWLMARGIAAYSPIVESHFTAQLAGLDPLDHELWMRQNQPMMEGAAGLLVIKSAGWRESRGLVEEIAFFRESCLPIYGVRAL